MVGTPGASADGLALPTAMARRRPDFMCGAAPPAEPNMVWVSPAITAVVAGALPLYGMRSIFTPAMWLNNTAPMKFELPGPPTATLISPGFALAIAIRSLTDFTGN